MCKPYRVVYYTASGCRSKDFDQEIDALLFYTRHVSMYPEYQDHNWSRTELIDFAKGETIWPGKV